MEEVRTALCSVICVVVFILCRLYRSIWRFVSYTELTRVSLRDIRRASVVKEEVCCFIDDNPNKWGRTIDGVIVAGGRQHIPERVKKYDIDKIYLAIPSASAMERWRWRTCWAENPSGSIWMRSSRSLRAR